MNPIELLQQALVELTHTRSTNRSLLRNITRTLTKFNTGKKFVICINQGDSHYKDGLTVGNMYEVRNDGNGKYSVGDDYARIISHPKELFLSVEDVQPKPDQTEIIGYVNVFADDLPTMDCFASFCKTAEQANEQVSEIGVKIACLPVHKGQGIEDQK